MRSDTVKKGIQQAPHRSLFNALGLTEEELQKPLIGVVRSYKGRTGETACRNRMFL